MSENKVSVYTDGGARGNPGPAAIGIVISYNTDEKVEVLKRGKYLGETTNNFAEYSALVEALTICHTELFPETSKKINILCFLDSELVVKQLKGLYKVKDSNLAVLNNKVKVLALNFLSVTYTHVPRAQNKEADKIVNEVLDSI